MDERELMRAQVSRYFGGEKRAGLLALLAGALSGLAAVWLSARAPGQRGLILPMVLGAVIELALGWVGFTRAGAQREALRALLASDEAGFRAQESARMERLRRSFAMYKTVELVLLAAGVGLALVYAELPDAYWAGVGLALQAAFMLAFDLFAERRAAEYGDHVRRLAPAG